MRLPGTYPEEGALYTGETRSFFRNACTLNACVSARALLVNSC
jgi:CMP-N-acetylneuraminic acid synthetase